MAAERRVQAAAQLRRQEAAAQAEAAAARRAEAHRRKRADEAAARSQAREEEQSREAEQARQRRLAALVAQRAAAAEQAMVEAREAALLVERRELDARQREAQTRVRRLAQEQQASAAAQQRAAGAAEEARRAVELQRKKDERKRKKEAQKLQQKRQKQPRRRQTPPKGGTRADDASRAGGPSTSVVAICALLTLVVSHYIHPDGCEKGAQVGAFVSVASVGLRKHGRPASVGLLSVAVGTAAGGAFGAGAGSVFGAGAEPPAAAPVVAAARPAESSATEALRAALAAAPGDVQTMFDLGNALMNEAEGHAEAERFFGRVLRLAPQHVPAMVSLGNKHESDGHGGEAEKMYRRALAIVPDFPGLNDMLANSLPGGREAARRHYDASQGWSPGLFDTIDGNRDGTLSQHEVQSQLWLAELSIHMMEFPGTLDAMVMDVWGEAFDALDVNHNGVLESGEVSSLGREIRCSRNVFVALQWYMSKRASDAVEGWGDAGALTLDGFSKISLPLNLPEFVACDHDKGGTVDARELEECLRVSMKMDPCELAASQFVTAADANESGGVTLKEVQVSSEHAAVRKVLTRIMDART